MRTLLPSIGAALLAASCFAGHADDRPDTQLRVRRGAFANDMVLTGELESPRGAAITVPPLPTWQTSIKWIAADGVEVKEGERVVELDNSAFASDLDSKRQSELQVVQEMQQKNSEWKADLEQKQLDLEKRRSELEKAKLEAAIPRDLVSSRDYEDRQMRLQRAAVEYDKSRDLLRTQQQAIGSDRQNLQLRLGKAQRDVETTEQAIESLLLRAPRAGIVVVREIPWEGRKLEAGDTVWVGFPLALIPEIDSLRVSVALPDVDDRRIAVGQTATIALDGYPGQQFSGKVTSISAVAQESARQSLRRAFRVVVSLDRIDPERMRPGLSARVTVHRERKSNVMLAPRASLDFATSSALLEGGKRVPVTLGSCNAQECVVLKGLQEGQRLARIGDETDA